MPPRSVTRVCDRCGRWFGEHEPNCFARRRRLVFIFAIVALAGGILYLALSGGVLVISDSICRRAIGDTRPMPGQGVPRPDCIINRPLKRPERNNHA